MQTSSAGGHVHWGGSALGGGEGGVGGGGAFLFFLRGGATALLAGSDAGGPVVDGSLRRGEEGTMARLLREKGGGCARAGSSDPLVNFQRTRMGRGAGD